MDMLPCTASTEMADASTQADNWFTHNLQPFAKELDFLAINEKITLLAKKPMFF